MSRNDYDYRELLQDYGNEYLQEYYPDDCIYEMDMVTEFITDVWEALRSAFFGYDWAPGADEDKEKRWQFNPNKEYFAFNGYGNLVSIDADYYVDWLDRCITESEFIDWCVERGYLDEEDEEEIEGIGATHGVLVGKILSVEYRNTSYYGNNSYWVYMDTDKGFVKAYTSANASLGYTIESMEGKTVGFNYTKRKDGGVVLHQVADGWDYYGNRK